MKLIDLREMPGANLSVPNGMDSVSRDLVVLHEVKHRPGSIMNLDNYKEYPYCKTHGAMNRVSKDGIYRCLQHGCHVGAYLIEG